MEKRHSHLHTSAKQDFWQGFYLLSNPLSKPTMFYRVDNNSHVKKKIKSSFCVFDKLD